MDDIPQKIDSKFRYVLLAATRAEQIMRGAEPKVEKPLKPTSAGMAEIQGELVDWDYQDPDDLADDEAEAAEADAD